MTVPFCVGVAIMEKFVSPSANNYKAKSWNNIRDISKLKLSQKSQIGGFLVKFGVADHKGFCRLPLFLW